MRRFEEDARHEHSNLLRLTPQQRLFVQRWVELFDRETVRGLRCRPFWPDRVREERARHADSRFHSPILDEELSAPTVDSLESFDIRALMVTPARCAESLAASVSALGFHHGFLFHAYKSMLYPPETSFEERIGKLRSWWLANAHDREMQVVFRVTKTGRDPPSSRPDLRIIRWDALPETVRECGKESLEWWSRHQECALKNYYVVAVTVSARDAVSAAEKALERYCDYRSVLRATSPGVRALEIDDEWCLVHDPVQVPEGRDYPTRLAPDRFRLRGAYERGFAEILAKACDQSPPFMRYVESYSMAVEDAKVGKPREALPNIARGLDLAFDDYVASGDEAAWGPPRLFVEKGAILMALDWCRNHFHYVLEYCLRPSFALQGGSVLSERRPEVAFDILSLDVTWSKSLKMCDWDELLKYRRDEILQELRGLPTTIQERHRQLRWDLARAVRARNSLFHQGLPLQDEYLLGLFLDVFGLVLRLRVVAHQHSMSFNDLVHMAEEDFDGLASGSSEPPDGRAFAAFGWRRWQSTRGDDLAE